MKNEFYLKNFTSKWIKYSDYEFRKDEKGNIYITPAENSNYTIYDPFEKSSEILFDLIDKGINLHMETRVTDVDFENNKINGILLSDGSYVKGDVFIETTGTTGPMGYCLRYGNGCSMCILRCPAFGPRLSISARCGVADIQGERNDDVLGAFSGSCKLAKESLSDSIREQLDKTGVVVLKVPSEDVNYGKLSTKVCQQYALKEFAENVVLLDTGHAMRTEMQQ